MQVIKFRCSNRNIDMIILIKIQRYMMVTEPVDTRHIWCRGLQKCNVVFNVFITILLDTGIWTTLANLKAGCNSYVVIKQASTTRKPVYHFEGVHIASINGFIYFFYPEKKEQLACKTHQMINQ